MLVFSMSMTFAGSFGVPRRHWDITFTQRALRRAVLADGGPDAGDHGGGRAGGGARRRTDVEARNQELHAPGRGWRLGPAPGTVVFVAVFLLAFMLYYFVNWKALSFLWKIG
jgi:cytochrome c oxidase subunit I